MKLKFVRALVDDAEIDLSAYDVPNGVSMFDKTMLVSLSVEAADSNVAFVYLDDFILTTMEP